MKRIFSLMLTWSRISVMCALPSISLAQTQAAVPSAAQPVADAPKASASNEPGLFAKINTRRVSQGEFHAAFGAYLRQKYYHGRVPDEDLVKARDVVTDQIVNSILLSEEAVRRGIEPKAEEVEKRVKGFDQQNARSPEWQRDRERLLPQLRGEFEEIVRVAQLEAQIRDAVSVSADEARAYHRSKPELFTEPERLHVHAILLGVDPSSPVSVWDAALAEAQAIVRRIRGGANFADIARMVSSDPSSAQGGDMGYVHLGMLPDVVQTALATFKLGEVGEPVRILEGIGVFRVDERTPAKLRSFDEVRERAEQLALRDKKDHVWKEFLASLRAKADIVISEGRPAATKAQN
jgi:parvulin-like peptidyl-prolyl isomerase